MLLYLFIVYQMKINTGTYKLTIKYQAYAAGTSWTDIDAICERLIDLLNKNYML